MASKSKKKTRFKQDLGFCEYFESIRSNKRLDY